MNDKPADRNAIAFFDGQNLFNAAKEAFGYPYPNYDPLKLAQAICAQQKWGLSGVCFYTGVPDPAIDPKRHHFWASKLAVMGTRGIRSFTRPIRYQNEIIRYESRSENRYQRHRLFFIGFLSWRATP